MHQLLTTTGLATALAFGTFGPVAISASPVSAFEIVVKQPHTSKPKSTRSHRDNVRHDDQKPQRRHYAIVR